MTHMYAHVPVKCRLLAGGACSPAARSRIFALMARAEEHRWVIDALEEGVARIEEDGKRMLTIPRYLVPSDAREGQLLRVTHTDAQGVLTIGVAIDAEATSAALARSVVTTKRAMAGSKKHDIGGDVIL